MRTVALFVCAALLLAPEEAAAQKKPALQRRIDTILDRPAFTAATWGVEVRDLSTGRVVYARNAHKNVKPASTLKLVTSAAALDAFGPDLTLPTTVETTARLDGLGRILGDVYLVGGGDPNLSGRFSDGRVSAPFEALAEQLHAAGVRRVEGRVIGHDGLFAGEPRGEDWTWGDLTWGYGAEVSALSFNDNGVDLTVSGGERIGDPVVLERVPESSYYRISSTATTSAAGSPGELVVRRRPGTSHIEISGSWPRGTVLWTGRVALEEPALYAATAFREVLLARGIRVAGEAAKSSAALPEGRRVLARLESRPMSEMLAVVNKHSQNLHTEMMLRLLGARVGGEGTFEAGRTVVLDFLRRVGVKPEPWSLQDASGLSRSDLVTPHEMVSLLAAMHRHRHAAAYRDTLPVAAVDGTLAGRMKNTAAQGNAAAKTGSIRNVNALAGYVTARGGRTLAFYIAANHHTSPPLEATTAIDQIVTLLAGS